MKMINGENYRHCIAWHFVAGNGAACFDMCKEEQRKACQEQQEKDKIKEEDEQKIPK